MEQVNVFHKGVVSDLDYSVISPDMWVFPTIGARMVNLSGKGYVIQNFDGTKELFSLPSKHIPLGFVEHDNILYIASTNPETGFGSIGSYPSPDWSGNSLGLLNEFKPLKNLMHLGLRLNLTTHKFNFSPSNMISMQAKTSYDGSTDIYLADHRNPLRMVNTGFTKEGRILDRVIHRDDFDSTVNVIQSTSKSPMFSFKPFGENGDLRNGNYFVYVRYVTKDFNETEFLAESFAFALYQDRNEVGEYSEGGISEESSGKSINFTLSNLDQTYEYVEFALIRYYGDNGPVAYSSYIYQEYFKITNETMDFNLAYWDRVVPFPEEEILAPRNRDIIPKDIVYFDNTLWGANWKEKDRYRKVLEEYAKRVMIFPRVYEFGDHRFPWNKIREGSSTASHYYITGDFYDDPQEIYNRSAYFRGETYAFALNYKFKDGDITDAYPTAGRDDYDNDTCHLADNWETYQQGTAFNQDGIYRTPKADLISSDNEDRYQLIKNNDRRLLYLEFDFTEANRWLDEDCDVEERMWGLENIRGYRVVRSERKKNIITQGLSMSQVKPEGTLLNIQHEIGITIGNESQKEPSTGNSHNLVQFRPDDGDFDYSVLIDPVYNVSEHRYSQHRHSVLGRETIGTEEVVLNERGKECMYPYYKAQIPMWGVYKKTSTTKRHNTISYSTLGVMIPNEYGLFSTDFLFNRALNLDSAKYVKRVGRSINGILDSQFSHNVNPISSLSVMRSLESENRDASILDKKATPLVGNETISNAGGYNNKCIAVGLDYTSENKSHVWNLKTTGTSKTWTISNRNFSSLPYIAFILDNTDSKSDVYSSFEMYKLGNNSFSAGEYKTYNLDVVNLCEQNPDNLNILNWYNKHILRYKPVTEFMGFIDSVDVWRGDCFLNRTTLNIMGWTDTNAETDQGGNAVVGDSDGGGGHPSGKYPWDWAKGMSEDDHQRYAHGITLSIVTENKYNTAYRYHNRYSQNSYYDREAVGGANRMGQKWLIRPWKSTTRESLLLNTGNSVPVPEKLINIFPYLQPHTTNVHPTRIRYSGRYTPGAFYDSTRQFDVLHFKDFDYAYGPINALYHQSGMLISIQDSIINRHYVNEQALQIGQEGESLLLGTSPEYLAQQTYTVGEFGSRHKWGTISNEMGIYGVDWHRGVIWKTGFKSAGTHMVYVANDITIEKSIRTWLENLYKMYNPESDPTKLLADTPSSGEGVLLGYDRLNREILFTFLLPIESTEDDYDVMEYKPLDRMDWYNTVYPMYFMAVVDGVMYYARTTTSAKPGSSSDWVEVIGDIEEFDETKLYEAGSVVIGECNGELRILVVSRNMVVAEAFYKYSFDLYLPGSLNYISNYIKVERKYYKSENRTLVLSEKNDAFIGEAPFAPKFYGLLDNAFFMANPNEPNQIHIGNQPGKVQEFFGEIEEFSISFVVVGVSGEQSAAVLMKYFKSLDIEINDIELSHITYKTELQEGIYIYSKNSEEFWKDAEYFENKMKLPIFVQTNPDTEFEDNGLEFYEGSDMKGTYLVVTLHYKPETEAEKVTLRNVITSFNISQS